MTMQSMFGVVLWSDTTAQKAVIWCEDQGELAYYTPEECIHEAPSLDAGDLVQFDVTVKQNVRKASNPQLLMQSHSPDLPRKLKASNLASSGAASPATEADTQNIIDLSHYQDAEPEGGKIAMG
ncbi:hypothetical protein ACG74X_07770 [Marivita sp. S0852]|uniref:hypothetical protein n=1 Tax=Marivita sp. S0852 TaxID=3373893 RepID=UPI0039824A9D